MIVKYTKAEFEALIEKKLKEAIETGFKERSQFTKKELLEQIIEIDDEGEESLLAWEEAKEAEEVQDWELEEAIAEAEEAELDEKVASYESKVETEEDERDKKERRKKEKETKRKTELGKRNREENGEFYSFWGGRMEELRSLFPKCENFYVGKNRGRKFKRDFKKETLLFLKTVDDFISLYLENKSNIKNIAFIKDLNDGKKYYFDENNNVRCLDDDWEKQIEDYKKRKKEGELQNDK